MSIRSEIRPYQVITSGSMSANATSLVTVIQKISLVTYTVSWSGTTPVGTLSVQISNDYEIGPTGSVVNGGNWSNTPFYSSGSGSLGVTLAVSGNTGSDNLSVPLCGAYAIRLVYTRTSGTGTLQAYICGKVA